MRRTTGFALLGVLCVLIGLGAAPVRPDLIRGAHAQDLTEHRLVHGGMERRYLLDVPRNAVQGAGRVPLVLVLHGGGGTAESAARMTGFGRLARREGFIVAYPEGTSRRDRMFTWNAGHCCGYAMRRRIDDIGFLGALIDRLVRDQAVDPDRVYVTGLSNGGMMAHWAGIGLSDQVAAIGPVIAGLFGDEPRPSSGVSAIIINGALDESVPTEGGQSGGLFAKAWDGTPLKPAAYQGAFWAAANGCDPAARNESAPPKVSIWRHACPAGVEVVRVLVLDNGHAWPGGRRGSRVGDEPSRALNATETLWAFFSRQRR